MNKLLVELCTVQSRLIGTLTSMVSLIEKKKANHEALRATVEEAEQLRQQIDALTVKLVAVKFNLQPKT